MNPISLAGGSAAALCLALAACAPPHPQTHNAGPLRTIARLDCPSEQGDLSRKSTASDGMSCEYADNAGTRVTLQLISLEGKDPAAALAPVEANLKAEIPASADKPAGGGASGDKVDIDLPGIHIHSSEQGGTKVDTGSVHVDADSHGSTNNLGPSAPTDPRQSRHGGVEVSAGENGAQVRVAEPGSGVRSTFILTSDTPGAHGYKFAGYEARGPSGGPIAVVSVLAKDGDQDDLRDEARALLKRNVGG